MELSAKQKTISEFFSAFSKSSLNFEHFQQKITFMAEVFPKLLWLQKMRLDQCLKSFVSEDPSKSNMVNGPKYVEIWMTAPLPYLLINVKTTDLEKVSLR